MPKKSRPAHPDDVTPGDSSLRWWVRSRTGNGKYLVDLGSYNGVPRCTCTHYQTRIEPLIRHMRKPEEAVEAGLLKVQAYHEGPYDVFTCWHVYRARRALCDAFVKKLLEVEAARKISR